MDFIHIHCRDGFGWREEENNADKENPGNGDVVERCPPFPKGKRTVDKADLVLVDLVGKDNGNVGYVEGRRGDVEDGSGCLGRPNRDAVQTYAEENYKPDCVDRGQGILIDS